MKPVQVVLLVVVSAVAGGLFMKWEISRNTTPVAAASPASTATPAPVAVAAPVHEPAVQQPQPVDLAKPVPATARVPARAQKDSAFRSKPQEVVKSEPLVPVMEARVEEPPAAPAAIVPQLPSQPVAQPAQPAYPEPAQQFAQPEPPAEPASAPNHVILKPGMVIAVRTGEGLSSERNSAGDGFSAILDEPLVVDGWVIAERGARAEGKVVETTRGRELVVALTHLRTSDGQRIAVETETFTRKAQLGSGDSAGKVIAGTIIGAAIGALAGGGKGAAIGAGVGTAAGAGTAAATRSRPAVLPAESLIRFRLKTAVTITERPGRT